MGQEIISMSRDELKRVKVLERLLGDSMTSGEAAESLGVTVRQLRRLKSSYKQSGELGLIHGNRGRKPAHTLPEECKLEVLRLYGEKYHGSNFCHYSELLEEHENIKISPSSIERILKAAGISTKHPKRHRPKKHRPRKRRTQAGMLWQIDATPYEWLGAEYGKFALHAAIDDATGIVTGAMFTSNECLEGYCRMMMSGIGRYGVPMALYSDRHTIFRSPKASLTVDEELDGQRISLTNFGKAMVDLGIEHIKATTPQAKGRVERLWETLQDRLPVELRLLGVEDINGANEALASVIDKHNRNYSVVPAENADAYCPLDASVSLDYVFAWRETRKIGNGGDITYKNNLYVPSDPEYNFNSRVTVEVRETFSGEVVLWHNGQILKLRKIERAHRLKDFNPITEDAARVPNKPAPEHPWRQFKISGKQRVRVGSAIPIS
jgi:transposase